VDHEGERGSVPTRSPRQPHIRRQRATSNICTNQGLLALSLAIRASLIGRAGFVETGKQCLAKARYLRSEILKLPGYAPAFADAPYFNELAVKVRGGSADQVCKKLEEQGIIAGFDLGREDRAHKDRLLIAVTERHRREDLDRMIHALAAV
jgi:glycine dehydrogenase subunit 1